MNHRKPFILFLSIAGIIVVLVILLSLFSNNSAKDEQENWFGTFSTEPQGYKAFYLMLLRLDIPVKHLTNDISSESDEVKSVWVLNPFVVSHKQKADLREWIEKGNTLITTGRRLSFLLDEEKQDNDIGREFLIDSIFSRPNSESAPEGDEVLLKQVDRVFFYDRDKAKDEQSKTKTVDDSKRIILSAGQMPLLIEETVGEGRIIYLLQPQMFNNENINKADNAVLAYNLAYNFAGDSTICFDEGIREYSSTWHLLFTPPFLWVSLQIILASLIFIYASSRRFGPIKPLPLAPRRSKDEYIYALANLLLKKRNNHAILEIIRSDFFLWLHRTVGIPTSASQLQIAEELHTRYGVEPEKLQFIFNNIEKSKSLSEQEWLTTINKIEEAKKEVSDGKN